MVGPEESLLGKNGIHSFIHSFILHHSLVSTSPVVSVVLGIRDVMVDLSTGSPPSQG